VAQTGLRHACTRNQSIRADIPRNPRLAGEISSEMNHPDRQIACHALRGVLFAVRDGITGEEAANFASQLPLLVPGIFY
jgi:uncharacterized protein (DUF2267 family)